MSFQPLISVIIPAYNAASFIEETLRSVQAQTYGNLEILVVDDGSSDETWKIIELFSKKDPRIVPIKHEVNAGLAATRNTALKQAQGELIAFLDADDVWLPEKTSRQADLFRLQPHVNLTFTNYYLWDGTKDVGLRYNKPKDFSTDNLHVKIIYACPFAPSSVMVRHDFLRRVGGFDPSFPGVEDWDLWLRMADTGMESKCVREPMFRYRLHPGNMSKNTIKMSEGSVRVLEKNRDASRIPSNLRHYRRSLRIARSNLLLARARQFLETNPDRVSPAIFEAWRANPRQIKWLLRWAGSLWPQVLGGIFIREYAHRKLREKF
jgi:glycosyltransferase involved in cell wall biosynthesis